MSSQNFYPNIVRSDQGRSRNLFLDYENKLSNVTLVCIDDRHSCAHKGSKIQNQYVFILFLSQKEQEEEEQ